MGPRRICLPICLLLIASGQVARAHDWPQLGYDGARARATSEVSGAPFRLIWKAPASTGAVIASPAVADGYVVVAGSDGQIRGLNASDGSPRWQLSATAGLGASPAILRGRVYVPTLGGHLMSIRLGDGSLVWDRPLGGQNYGSPVVVGDSLVLATGFPTQKVVRIDAASGDVQWETAPGVVAGLANSSPAIDGGQVVFGMNNGRYQSLDLGTGAASWAADTQGLVNLSGPLLVGRAAFFVPGGRVATVYAVDRATGKTLGARWPLTIVDPGAPDGTVVSVRHAVSSPTLAGGMVVFQIRFEYAVGTDDSATDVDHVLREYVVAVDPSRAAVAWQRLLGTRRAGTASQIPELGLCPAPAVFATASGPALAVASSVSTIVRVIAAATGAEQWSALLVGPTRSSPVVANGQLFVGTENGFLQAFISDVNHAPPAPTTGFVPGGGSTLDGAGTGAAMLRWNPAVDDEAAPLTYQVRLDSDGEVLESWMAELTPPPGESAVVLPKGLLRAAGDYVYRVRSRDTRGAFSAWSEPQQFKAAVMPWIEVRGSTYESIEAAVAAAPPGSVVRLGRGVLQLAGTVRLPPGASLVGAGAHDTVLDGTGLAAAIEIGGAGGDPSTITGLTVAGAWVGVKVGSTKGHVLRNLIVRDNVRAGIDVAAGGGAQVVNATIVRNGTGAASAGTLAVRSSIIADNDIGLSRRGDGTLASRYDDLFGNRTVNYEGVGPGPGDISMVVVFMGETRHDFRLANLQATTDRGDPADDFSSEPAPNGGRVNLGAFGNTEHAESSAIDATWTDQVNTVAETGCSMGGHGEPPLGGSLLAIFGAVFVAKRRSRRAPVRRRKRRMAWLLFR